MGLLNRARGGEPSTPVTETAVVKAAAGTDLSYAGERRRTERWTLGRPFGSLLIGQVPQPPLDPIMLPPESFPFSPATWAGWPDEWKRGWEAYGGDFSGGVLVGQRVSTVFTCVDLLSRLSGQLGTGINRASQPLTERPAWLANPEPLLYSSWVDWVKATVNSLLMHGDAIVVPTARYSSGRTDQLGYPARFVTLNPYAVTIVQDPNTTSPRYYIGDHELDPADVLHLRYQLFPGEVRGAGPLQAASRNVAAASFLEAYGTQLAREGGLPMAVLETDDRLNKTQTDEVKEGWRKAMLSRGVDPVILSAGLRYHAVALSPKELGLLDLRQFDESRIASTFGIPLWLVGLPQSDGLTYSTAEMSLEYLYRVTLRPLTQMIASALSLWALPAGTDFVFDSDVITRPQLKERMEAYKTAIEAGVMSVDEVRALENLPRLTPELGAPASDAVGVNTAGDVT